MKSVSTFIARWLLKKGVICNDDYDLYEYAIFSVVFTLFPVVLVIIISSLMHMVLSGIFLIIPFVLMRKFAGGFHFKSSLSCLLASSILLTAFLYLIAIIKTYSLATPYFLLVIMATVALCAFSPIDSAERKLSLNEVKLFRRIVIVLSILNCCLYAILFQTEYQTISIALGSSQVMTAGLQLPCIITRQCIEGNNSNAQG